MGHENDDLAFQEIQHLSFWITFAVACILCILICVQRIRRRHLGRYAPPERRMDPHLFPPEKGGGEPPAGGVVGRGVPYSGDPFYYYGAAQLPSACDILLPLSHSTHLPSSGYLATVLGRERDARSKQSFPPEVQVQPPCVAPSDLGANNSRPSTSGTNDGLGGSPAVAPESLGSRIGGADLRPESHTGDAQEISDPSTSDKAPTIQKRSHLVQQLIDVDDEGVRTYRRTTIEYN
ncbi:hypothetical protein BDV25DRAFT_159767 [Aspergillus avenaceus]|uniref:Uncharacterized protein n=1 Tax=Aspergillus avenaceus TaxID=36643 RepID=A0A5N6TMX4_ASPAV|nr:hypothetical protein BDV25DRAFT_159767 [Aspergillus avenaceus]